MPGTIPLTSTGMTLVGGPTLVAVDSTTGGKSLATLLGAALPLNLKRLKILPASTGIFFAGGSSASTVSPPLPAGVWSVFDIRKSEADLLRFVVASTAVNMTVVQEG